MSEFRISKLRLPYVSGSKNGVYWCRQIGGYGYGSEWQGKNVRRGNWTTGRSVAKKMER